MPAAKHLHSGASTRNQHTATSTSTARRLHIAAFAARLPQRSAEYPSAPAVASHASNTGIRHCCFLRPRESRNQPTAMSTSTARCLHIAAFVAHLSSSEIVLPSSSTCHHASCEPHWHPLSSPCPPPSRTALSSSLHARGGLVGEHARSQWQYAMSMVMLSLSPLKSSSSLVVNSATTYGCLPMRRRHGLATRSEHRSVAVCSYSHGLRPVIY